MNGGFQFFDAAKDAAANSLVGQFREPETGQKLRQIISGSREAREGNVSVFISAIGLFKAIPSSERYDYNELQYEFTITEIE